MQSLGRFVIFGLAIIWIALIVWPFEYCLTHHGCSGPADLDAFMPAFMFAPLGIVAVIASLFIFVKKPPLQSAGTPQTKNAKVRRNVFIIIGGLVALFFIFHILLGLYFAQHPKTKTELMREYKDRHPQIH